MEERGDRMFFAADPEDMKKGEFNDGECSRTLKKLLLPWRETRQFPFGNEFSEPGIECLGGRISHLGSAS
jgi:hypothetical protein